MAATMFQLIGFMLSGLGLFLISAATAMDMWAIQDRSFVVITSAYSYYGLWRDCVTAAYGTDSCRPYFTILGLPGLFQAVRALMIVGIVLAAIGVLIAIFALKCIRMGNMEDKVKATMTLSSGVMFILGGICAIAGVSVFANLIVVNFSFATYASADSFSGAAGVNFGSPLTPRYTFGAALFVGWVGGAVLVIGGIMMCLACRGLMPEQHEQYKGTSYRPPHSAVYRSEGKTRAHYDESFRANSMEGRQSKFDYV